jgi:hypothetical protein
VITSRVAVRGCRVELALIRLLQLREDSPPAKRPDLSQTASASSHIGVSVASYRTPRLPHFNGDYDIAGIHGTVRRFSKGRKT